MKIRLLFIALICALTSLPVLRAEDGAPKAAAKEETELDHVMDRLNKAYGKVRRQVSDATKNADSIAQVAIMKEAAEAAVKLEPKWKADKPADEQAKFVADYQAKMKETIAQIAKLEEALKAGNNEEAAKIFGVVRDAQKAGHKEFKKPDPKKG
ncbi:MAG TPA: cytochrome b562 [Opitutaceae bacterium]|nr:cytochrome b562 [Opitutaceae bacterium]